MNRTKTYIFDTREHPYVIKVTATAIFEAKQRVKAMGHRHAYFVKIQPYTT
jgi:hypothetical protein